MGRTSGATRGDTPGTTTGLAPLFATAAPAGAGAGRDSELLGRFSSPGADHVTVVVAGDAVTDQSAELVGASPGGPGLATGGRRPDPAEVGA